MGLAWFEEVQWGRTVRVIEQGDMGTPWQYRFFTDGGVYGTVHFFEWLGLSRPIGTAFVLIRLLQNTLSFTLAVYYYRKLGLTTMEGLLGISLLGWGMCHALYDGDLTFNTYSEVSIFLTAGLLILHGKFWWLVPLMVIAPFNRETSGFIPMLLLFSQWSWGKRPRIARETLVVFAVCLGLWCAIVGGLRVVYGLQPYIVPTAGKSPIFPLLWFNLTWWRTWVFLFATLGLIPLLMVGAWGGVPVVLRRFFWAVVPVWFPALFSLAHAPETRLFLVPQFLIFLPGALFGVRYFGVRAGESGDDFTTKDAKSTKGG